MAYQRSAVPVETWDMAQRALLVSERMLVGTPRNQPEIRQLRVVDDNGIELPIVHPIELGARLLIKGKNLRGQNTQVLIGNARIDAEVVSDNEIRLLLLPMHLVDGCQMRAGINGLQIMHLMDLAIPPQPYPIIASNVMPFSLRPRINLSLQGRALRVHITPRVSRRQRVLLILNELSNSDQPKGYRLDAPAENGITDIDASDTDSIDFSLLDVVASTYLVRLRVDGAESALSQDEIGLYTQPQLTLT